MGDIDGDGKLDVVYFKNAATSCPSWDPGLTGTQQIRTMFASTFYDLNGNVAFKMDEVAQQPACSLRPYDQELNDSWFLFDFNGDGRDDLMVADAEPLPQQAHISRWHVFPSLGRPATGGMVFDQRIQADLLPSCEADPLHCIPVSAKGNFAQLADFNSDGLVDFAYLTDAVDETPFGSFSIRIQKRERVGSVWRFSFSKAMKLDVIWSPRDGFDCTTALGDSTVVDGINGHPAPLPGEGSHERIFMGCSARLRDPDHRTGRGILVTELNGDGRADLMFDIVHDTRMFYHQGEDCVVRNQGGRGSTAASPLWMRNDSHRETLEMADWFKEVAGLPPENNMLILDRPFLFFIRDVETGQILFVGRVLNPQ